MDLAYFDPDFVPNYNPPVSPEAMQLGVSTCTSQGLTGDLLQACITDVSVTQDVSMLRSTVYQPACPSGCSGRGASGSLSCFLMHRAVVVVVVVVLCSVHGGPCRAHARCMSLACTLWILASCSLLRVGVSQRSGGV